jgi:hypothetical protein
MFRVNLRLAMVIAVMDGDLPFEGVDRHVDRLRKGGALLHKVIAEQPKLLSL